MKTFLTLLVALAAATSSVSAQCVDPSLIDLNAPCPFIYAPVCGCDDVTYDNDCIAENFGGVTSWVEGPCAAQPGDCVDPALINPDMMCLDVWAPVCGCDGVTYSNDCYAINYGGVTDWVGGECSSTGGDCIDSLLINPDMICLDVWAPVCGCDGMTYSNECYAVNYGGVTSWIQGECSTSGECLDLAGVDFGQCDMYLGVAVVNSVCINVSGCGWEVNGTDYSPFFFPDFETCQFTCGFPPEEPECLNLEGLDFGQCDMFLGYALVGTTCIAMSGCGWEIGGVDYANNFFFYLEACQMSCEVPVKNPECLDLDGLDFGQCDMFLGYALVGLSCIDVSGCSWEANGTDYANHFFETYQECVSNCDDLVCIDQTIIDPEYLCDDVDAPVCGCDEVTYINACEAVHIHGVLSYTSGPCTVGLSERNGAKLHGYPNPFNEYFVLTGLPEGVKFVRVVDITGREVFSVTTALMRVNVTASSAWPAGCYLVHVIGENSIPLRLRIIRK